MNVLYVICGFLIVALMTSIYLTNKQRHEKYIFRILVLCDVVFLCIIFWYIWFAITHML